MEEVSHIGLDERIGTRLTLHSIIMVFLPAVCCVGLAYNQGLLCSPDELEKKFIQIQLEIWQVGYH